MCLFCVALASLSTFNSQLSTAQSLEWDLRFDTKFDNREYDGVKYLGTVPSITFFSLRLAPAVGIGWRGESKGDGVRHRVMAGVSYTLDMGADAGGRDPEPLVFYNYRSPEYGLWAGKFERRHLIGSYASAIYAGSYVFYDNVIDGFALQYHPRRGRLELVLDWDGMASETERKSFRVLSAGEWSPVAAGAGRWLAAGYSFDMYHLGSRTGMGDGVVDHILVNPWIGGAFERLVPWFERLSVKAGWMGAFDRDRGGENRWLTPGGVSVEATIQRKKVGVRNIFYSGGLLMPLWHIYGGRVYKGDPFYAGSRVNNYTQLFWYPELTRGVTLRLELGMHTDGRNVGLQQVAWVGVTLDNDFFRRNR